MAEAVEQDTLPFVVFRLGDEEYAVSIDHVRSIIKYQEPTPVPRASEVVQGVINMRGCVIPIIDLSKRLRGRPFEPSPTARIVVIEGAAGTLGLAVDAANEVAHIPPSDIKSPPESVLSPETVGAISGVADREGRLIIVLDLDETIPRAEYARTGADGADTEEGEEE